LPVRWDGIKWGKELPPLRPKPPDIPSSGIEETVNPDGSWERRYYGRDMEAAKGELKDEADRSLQEWAVKPTVRVRQRGKEARSWPVEMAERFEKIGTLVSLRSPGVFGVPWGGRRPGCDRCGCIEGGLRYVIGQGWMCKRRCLGDVEH